MKLTNVDKLNRIVMCNQKKGIQIMKHEYENTYDGDCIL